jgi:hypothetical protein
MKILFLSLLACLVTLTARAELYLYTDLGTSNSYVYIAPAGISNNGSIVGSAYENTGDGRPVAFTYTSGTIHLVPSPGPAHSAWGNAINSFGTIAGLCDRNGSVLHEFYAPAGGAAVDFDSDFTRNSEAVAINDSNFVVGKASAQPFLGHTSGWMLLLGSTLGNSFQPRGLNSNLEIVGNGPFGGMVYNAWTGTSTYMGFALGTFSNQANAINSTGTVAGKVGTQGYLYASGLVTYFGSGVSEVKAMNSAGDTVGTANNHAFVYLRASGHFVDLNNAVTSSISSTWTLVSATGINDSGVICGQARRPSTPAESATYGAYVYRGYRLSPFILHLPLSISP